MKVYIVVDHSDGPSPDREPEYIGPFPEYEHTVKHFELWGPALGEVKILDFTPPEERTMSPGQAVDYSLRMF